MAESEHEGTTARTHALVRKLDSISWGAFLIWIGIAFLANVGWGAGLLGLGVIELATQAARKYFKLGVERFWLVVGIAFLIWGVLEMARLQLGEAPIHGGLVPILFIVAGIALIASAVMRKP